MTKAEWEKQCSENPGKYDTLKRDFPAVLALIEEKAAVVDHKVVL